LLCHQTMIDIAKNGVLPQLIIPIIGGDYLFEDF
jgi:hypothetical protein